jgi:hypothetical protein
MSSLATITAAAAGYYQYKKSSDKTKDNWVITKKTSKAVMKGLKYGSFISSLWSGSIAFTTMAWVAGESVASMPEKDEFPTFLS